jgi:DNA-binding NtrC family response regulator
MKGRILVVDNEESGRLLVAKILEKHGFEYDEADGVSSAKEKLETYEYDLLLTDKNMPAEGVGGEGGMELIRWVRLNKPNLPVILITGYPTVDSAVDALKFGIFDYLPKPLDLKLLMYKVEQVCEYRKSVNPEAVMRAYVGLNRKLTEAIHGTPPDIDWLNQVQDHLNLIFQVFRSVERSMLEHRQMLAEIQVFADKAMEDLTEDNPLHDTLKQISLKASQRI